MAAVDTSSSVPQLLTAVKKLTPTELREFKRRFAQWQDANGGSDEETSLVQACQARLSPADERALEKLVAKSERGILRPNELEHYRTLVRRAEKLDATRLAALTQLARRWGKPVRLVMKTIGSEGGKDDTTCYPARPSKAGARPRR